MCVCLYIIYVSVALCLVCRLHTLYKAFAKLLKKIIILSCATCFCGVLQCCGLVYGWVGRPMCTCLVSAKRMCNGRCALVWCPPSACAMADAHLYGVRQAQCLWRAWPVPVVVWRCSGNGIGGQKAVDVT